VPEVLQFWILKKSTIMIIVNNPNFINKVIKTLLIIFIIIAFIPVKVFNYFTDCREKARVLKSISILFICLLGVYTSEAQRLKKFLTEYQVGLESAFGIKTFNLTSDIAEIHNMKVIGEGGTVGIVWGAKAIRMKVRQGYYYSASSVAHTVNEVRSSAAINFYPLYFVNVHAGLRPYVIVGIERDIFHMHGHYGNENEPGIRNYSVSEAPFLGKIFTIQGSFGGGIEYCIKKPGHFLALFSEARYGKSISTASSNEFFKRTISSDQLTMNVGVAFGYHR
jgi:hypothetical protein